MRILVVDDDAAVRDSLRRALQLEGYDVQLAGDGTEALARLEGDGDADAVVLDVLMPQVDGLEVCRRLRAIGNAVPVLMLTARDEVSDRVAGLDAGADDYLVKPFALEELLARLRALLRRTNGASTDVLRFSDLELDPGTREVLRGGEPIELTRTEFSLLELFLLNPRQVLTTVDHLRARLGLRLRPRLQLARRLHRLPAAQAGAARSATPDPDGARRGLRPPRAMSFRTRIALAGAAAVAVAVAAASAITYVVVRGELRSEIDDALEERAATTRLRVVEDPTTGRRFLDVPPPLLGGAAGYLQIVTSDGRSIRPIGETVALPISDRDRAGRARETSTSRSSPTRTLRAHTSAC